MNGNTIIPNAIPLERIHLPKLRSLTNRLYENSPSTIDGIPAMHWITRCIILSILRLLQKKTRYSAVDIAGTAPITIAVRVKARLPVIAGRIPPSDPRTSPAGGVDRNSQVMVDPPFQKTKANRKTITTETTMIPVYAQILVKSPLICMLHLYSNLLRIILIPTLMIKSSTISTSPAAYKA